MNRVWATDVVSRPMKMTDYTSEEQRLGRFCPRCHKTNTDPSTIGYSKKVERFCHDCEDHYYVEDAIREQNRMERSVRGEGNGEAKPIS